MDTTPFKAPERYPEPPRNMYYEVPKTPTYQKPAPIFPWEKDAPKATRVFPEDFQPIKPPTNDSTLAVGEKSDLVISITNMTKLAPTDPWKSFTSRTNTWDEIPEIQRYIRALQKNQIGSIQVLHSHGSGSGQDSGSSGRRLSVKVTDFPSVLERPSLPVTPAPVRRPSFWGEERDEGGKLPVAEGVPTQADWVSLHTRNLIWGRANANTVRDRTR